MRRRTLAAWVAGAALMAGCSGAHHDTTPTTTAPSAPNPDVIPPVITPAYVDAVFVVLNHVYGNATRALVASKRVTPQVTADLRAIFNDPLYAKEVSIAHQSLAVASTNIRQPVGDVTTTVQRLITATAACIFVETSDDYGAVLVNPGPPPASGYWKLEPKQSGHDPEHLNTTPWALSFNAVFLRPTSIPSQCAAS